VGRVNNSGDISCISRAFISDVFCSDELGFEEVQENFFNVFFRDVES